MRLIDAHKLQKAFYEHNSVRSVTKETIIGIIKEQPTVDPVKHGHWEMIDEAEPRRYGCSVCHRMVWHYENYCPSCGARMDQEADHDDHL